MIEWATIRIRAMTKLDQKAPEQDSSNVQPTNNICVVQMEHLMINLEMHARVKDLYQQNLHVKGVDHK